MGICPKESICPIALSCHMAGPSGPVRRTVGHSGTSGAPWSAKMWAVWRQSSIGRLMAVTGGVVALSIGIAPLMADGATSSRSRSTKLPTVSQNVAGPTRGMSVVISLVSPIDVRRPGVVTDGGGDVAFYLRVVNTGTRNFQCEAVRAKAISTRQPTLFYPPVQQFPSRPICPGKGNTIAPKRRYSLSFFVDGNFTGVTTGLIVFPFGTNARSAVWRIPPGYGQPPAS